MAEDGRTTLGKLRRGDVFRTADGLLWRRAGLYPSSGPELVYCERVGADEESSHLRADTQVEPLDLPALLSELDELRTLTHDLLLDRDAAYGREVGRGEALAALRGAAHGVPTRAGVRTLAAAMNVVTALGPVRPLPPPERLTARCRTLEDALRGLALEAEAAGRYVEVDFGDDPGGRLDAALDAARKLLEEGRETAP